MTEDILIFRKLCKTAIGVGRAARRRAGGGAFPEMKLPQEDLPISIWYFSLFQSPQTSTLVYDVRVCVIVRKLILIYFVYSLLFVYALYLS